MSSTNTPAPVRTGRPRRAIPTGARFGLLVVDGPAPDHQRKGRRSPAWWCRCDCGQRVSVTTESLEAGTLSCGCLRKGSLRRQPVPVGEDFLGIVVVGPAPDVPDRYGHHVAWTCRCHCGALFTARAHNVKNFNTKSCGCARPWRTPPGRKAE
jgi:hypothetical protein